MLDNSLNIDFHGRSGYICNDKRIIERICFAYASTLKGREEYSRKVLSIKRLPPVLVDRQSELLYFACYDHEVKEYKYFNNYEIDYIKGVKRTHVEVHFRNGTIKRYGCSYHSMNVQRNRCKALLMCSDKRLADIVNLVN